MPIDQTASRETALITGASSGIGLELARLFAAGGYDLVLVARRNEALLALAEDFHTRHGVDVQVLARDLNRSSAPHDIVEMMLADGIHVDVVVNNAGVGARGAFAELDLQRQMDMIQVNVTALTLLTRLFLPGMLARNRGGILNVASTAAFQPGPFMAVYYATKAYVQSFTEAIAEEVSGSGLRVTCLSPGPTATEFAARAGTEGSKLLRRTSSMSAPDVARAGFEGWRRGRILVVPGATNTVGTWAVRFLPRRVVRKLISGLNR
ncbi:MAG: SDR family oxidoreductase [Gemmatimonadales bacterium]|nr:SDR family oxidoreductase [Gemmatimonadales bacterium]